MWSMISSTRRGVPMTSASGRFGWPSASTTTRWRSPASSAQTAQAASHGNFSLGLGLGAHEPERQAFGTAWPNTIRRLREHLTVLRSVFDEGTVDFHGDELTASPAWPVAVPGGGRISINN